MKVRNISSETQYFTGFPPIKPGEIVDDKCYCSSLILSPFMEEVKDEPAARKSSKS